MVVTRAGMVAWIMAEYDEFVSTVTDYHVCELPPDSQSPIALADSPQLGRRFLRVMDGRLYWHEAAASRSVPIS
jgi:hypothetical protein